MSWRDDPATDKQLNYLRQFGYDPEGPLTKGEACDLISRFSEDPERTDIRDENQCQDLMRRREQDQKQLAYILHQNSEETKQEINNAKRGELREAKSDFRIENERRLRFWKDTFRGPAEMEDFNEQAADLYLEFGQRFRIPTNKHIQDILDALDAQWPTWDRDTPGIFFQTLELNFPELLR